MREFANEVAVVPERVQRVLKVLESARGTLAGGLPVFGHMRLESAGRRFDVLLGAATRVGSPVSVLDWQRAPLAEAFFTCAEGEAYELEDGARLITGTLLERNVLRVREGRLELLHAPGESYRLAGEAWQRVADGRGPSLRSGLGPTRGASPVEVELDAAQRRAVELPPSTTVLVLGEAGVGKTTVALHRLAMLRQQAKRRFRAAVIVPTDGLCRLIRQLLPRLGVRDAEVWTFDRWAAKQARRVFPDLPKRESDHESAAVSRIKRHPAVRTALEALAELPPSVSNDDEDPDPPSDKLARRRDLQSLFGDRALLERIAAAAAGTISPAMVDEVFEHTHVQFSPTTEEEWAHVDAERLQTLDGRRIDAGTPMEDARSIDPEDHTVLFELERMRARRLGREPLKPLAWDCIVLDEAQELAPLELALVGRSLAPGGTLVVSGDSAQQVDPSSSFGGWAASMAELGCGEFETITLEESYRCPPEVTALARSIVGRGEVEKVEGPGVELAAFENEFEQLDWLAAELRSMAEQVGVPSVAVICRTPESARRIAGLLKCAVPCRLAIDGDFAFASAINVTCVQEVKGLEFELVVVLDASAAVYPATPSSARALYVAVTRASRRLVLSAVGAPSPLLASLTHR